MAPTPGQESAATRIIRDLLGRRFTWPPMRVVDRYPVVSSRNRVRLWNTPVREINSVTGSGSLGAVGYTLVGKSTLNLDLPADACLREVTVDVDYEYGSRPSGEVANAISIMAREMELAESNSPDCRIPDRVTSVNRQGVSWTLIDPQDFLEEGRTGIYEIDLMLRSTGSARAQAKVYGATYPPPDRLLAEQVEVP